MHEAHYNRYQKYNCSWRLSRTRAEREGRLSPDWTEPDRTVLDWTGLDWTGLCRAGCVAQIWFNGGRGAVFSRGLLKAIPSSNWTLCERDLTGAGDSRVSECIWQVLLVACQYCHPLYCQLPLCVTL